MAKQPRSYEVGPVNLDDEAHARVIGRREFVRTSTGLFVAATSLVGCADGNGPDTGIVRVTISGLPTGALSAGSAEISGGGISPIEVDLGSATSGEARVKAGTYNVIYSPPDGYAMAVGSSSEREVTVAAGGITAVEFNVTAVVTPTGVVFSSDFGAALGKSATALSDGGKWDLIAGEGQEIIAVTAGLAFPSTNVLRMTASAARQGFGLTRTTQVPVPSPPFIRNYRWYYRHASTIPGHPIQDGFAQSNTNWTFNPDPVDASTYRPNIGVGPSTPEALSRWKLIAPGLPTNQTFRWELQYIALNATTCRVHVRVFDMTGVEVRSDPDFQKTIGSQPQGDLGQNPILNVNNIANMNGLNCGLNGAFDGSVDTLHSYQGCFAVVDGLTEGALVGPYANGV